MFVRPHPLEKRRIMNNIILPKMLSDAMLVLLLNLLLQREEWGYVRDNNSNDVIMMQYLVFVLVSIR